MCVLITIANNNIKHRISPNRFTRLAIELRRRLIKKCFQDKIYYYYCRYTMRPIGSVYLIIEIRVHFCEQMPTLNLISLSTCSVWGLYTFTRRPQRVRRVVIYSPTTTAVIIRFYLFDPTWRVVKYRSTWVLVTSLLSHRVNDLWA